MRATARALLVLLAIPALLLLAACQPAQPSGGRATPVRQVLVLGDSISFGLFGTTPRVHSQLGQRMTARGINVVVDGFPGENPVDRWPGNPTWEERMRAWIAGQNPDMVVIQTTLFPDADVPLRQFAYGVAFRRLVDIAQSRGAHVYIVSHGAPPPGVERRNWEIAQRIQADVVAGRGISTIPLDRWLANCRGGFLSDGWHLGAEGQRCHADAVTAAVDQLRARVK
jgi:lysophospholipase L1-like esterase